MNASGKKWDKKIVPKIVYIITKKMLSIIKKKSFDLKMFIPVTIKVTENKYETNPRDWKNKSEIKLPWKPRIFFIFVLSGKMKFGSSGE